MCKNYAKKQLLLHNRFDQIERSCKAARSKDLIMLNDSLKRRWSVTPVGLDLGYEPPEKVRLVTNSGGSSDSRTQPLKRRILQDNFSPLKRRNCEAVFKGDFTRTVAQTDKCGKRKLSSCVEQSGIGSCGGGDQTVVDSVNLEFSKPLKRPRRSQVEQCHFHSQVSLGSSCRLCYHKWALTFTGSLRN